MTKDEQRATGKRQFDPLVIAVEVGSIVLAVLLAFSVNEWRDGRAAAARVEAVQEAVRQEATRNRQILAARLPYHLAMQDSVRAQQRRFDPVTLALRSGERLLALPELGFTRGLATASELTHAGWETALATDVLTHMDVDHVSFVSRVYAQQGMVNQTAGRLLEALDRYHGGIVGDQSADLGTFNFGATLTDIVLRQEEQLALYDSLLMLLPKPPR